MNNCRILLALLLCAGVAAARAVNVEDRRSLNGSFEGGNGANLPAGWTVASGSAAADAKVAREGKSSLRLGADKFAEVRVESPALELRIGKRYEVTAWVRTEGLEVRDVDRTPIAVGATLSMASLPFDYHSESVGGTRDWMQVRLRFVATRAQDRILCLAGLGGEARGKAWFDGVSIDEVSGSGWWPEKTAVETFGPAYRYPQGGWVYVHVEGSPYERGYQHGYLLAKEVPQYLSRCALKLDPKAKERVWDMARTSVNALFLRGFDQEILEEMKGIADGASARGAKWDNRAIDLVDIVGMNTLTELSLLRAALPMTPTGLEGLKLQRPEYFKESDVPVTERCSAFAATGPATRDGKMILAHITMWPLTLAEQTNIMLDIQPVAGRRVLMQSYPGGIQSGTDYYQNDAGIVLAETTIRQSPFNAQGTPVAYRARRAIQYANSVEEVVEHLGNRNNGLYTNEWLIGDAKTNHIAMYELGTRKTKLYRSSKDEWFGGTKGFYWGCNNAKDLNVRLEYVPDPKGAPQHLGFVPSPRDIRWQELYAKHKGQIDEQFAFLAFRTAPLVSASSFDAKLASADMASRMMCWAVFGKPNQREWVPTRWERENYPHITGVYSSGYRLIEAQPAEPLRRILSENEKERLAKAKTTTPKRPDKSPYKDKLWKGWILPRADSDIWLTSASAAYHQVLGSPEWEKELEVYRAALRLGRLEGDRPLRAMSAATTSDHWYNVAINKGVLLLDALRREMGDEKFLALMKEFFETHTTKSVSTADFTAAAEKAAGKPMQAFFAKWLDGVDTASEPGAVFVGQNLRRRLGSALIVYGTTRDAGANRHAAELLQSHFLDGFESRTPIRKDFAVSDEELARHDVVLVGRPETNSALAALNSQIGLAYHGASFRINGEDHGSENEAVMLAAQNPLNPSRMVLVLAGNSALETVRLASTPPGRWEYAVFDAGKQTASGFLKR